MTMKTIKVADATNIQLDWLVAKCEETVLRQPELGLMRHAFGYGKYRPTTNPAQMWPIIEREGISLLAPTTYYLGPEGHPFPVTYWRASKGMRSGPTQEGEVVRMRGSDGLIAAARCYVASKLGEEVEVPEELA